MERTVYVVRYNRQKGVKYAPGTFSVRFFLAVEPGNAQENVRVQGEDIMNGHIRCFNAPWYTWEKWSK